MEDDQVSACTCTQKRTRFINNYQEKNIEFIKLKTLFAKKKNEGETYKYNVHMLYINIFYVVM